MLESHANAAVYDHPGNMFLRKLKKRQTNKQTHTEHTQRKTQTGGQAGGQTDRQTETNITQDLLR